MEIREAEKFGITAEIKKIDFGAIMDWMRKTVGKSRERIEESLRNAKDFDFYPGEARFIGDSTLQVQPSRDLSGRDKNKPAAARTIRGKMIFLASGSRPLIPPIKGIEDSKYLTNESALQLRERPQSMIVIGGGYIGVELAHFFEAMGTKVIVMEQSPYILPGEEPEISEALKTALSRRMTVLTDTEAIEVSRINGKVAVTARHAGKPRELTAQTLLVAAGRKSNADLLDVDRTGVKTDERGYIVADDYFETTKKGIWAFGDAIGRKMFRHAANEESGLAWQNAVHGKKSKLNYLTVPHAVFTHPEVASVGLTEEQAVTLIGREEVLVGRAMYTDAARGEAMMAGGAFAKAVVHRKNGKILGYHIIGPQASVLIQEVVNAMAAGGNLWSVAKGMHIHPALSEVVLKAFGKLAEPG